MEFIDSKLLQKYCSELNCGQEALRIPITQIAEHQTLLGKSHKIENTVQTITEKVYSHIKKTE